MLGANFQRLDLTQPGLTSYDYWFFSPPTTHGVFRLSEPEFEPHFLRTIRNNLHTTYVLFGGMLDDPHHLRRWAAHLLALSMSTDDKEWAAHIALRAADYLAQAEEIAKKAREARDRKKTEAAQSDATRSNQCGASRRTLPPL
jgi:hypothetical protein